MKKNEKNKISTQKMDDFIDGLLSPSATLEMEKQIKSDPNVKKQYESNINTRKMLDTYFSTDNETYTKQVESDINALFSTTVQNQENIVSFKKNQDNSNERKGFLSYINITVDKLIPMAAAACFGFIVSPYLFNSVDNISSEDNNNVYLMRDLSNSEVFYEKVITDVITLKKNNFSADNDYLTNVPLGRRFFMQTVAPMDGDVAIFINTMSSDKPEDTVKGDVFFQRKNVSAGEILIFPEDKGKGILFQDGKGIRVDIEISSKSEVLKFTRYIYSELQK